jgi:hypothetical protein
MWPGLARTLGVATDLFLVNRPAEAPIKWGDAPLGAEPKRPTYGRIAKFIESKQPVNLTRNSDPHAFTNCFPWPYFRSQPQRAFGTQILPVEAPIDSHRTA